MERLKSLDPPHKGLRNALSKLCLLAGKTKYNNIEEVMLLQAIGKEVFHLLKDHTQTEEQYILAPLAAKSPESIIEDHADHERIEREEVELEKKLLAFDGKQTDDEGHAFYLDLCDFHARYLMHIDREDRTTELKMQEMFTDEELIGHQVQIMQAMDFQTLLLWFKYIVPARRTEENVQVLTAFKANAPKEAFDAVIDIIRPELSETTLNNILSKLV